MKGQVVAPTQSALLELKDERGSLREGYRFLDEKRLILAAEMLAEMARYEDARARFDADCAQAARDLRAAVLRHGLEGLALYPPAADLRGRLESNRRLVLGVTIQDVGLELDMAVPPSSSVAASPEAERCRQAFAALLPKAACLAGMAVNLERLRADYSRTARRARALEDVLLPEIEADLNQIESMLEELEREESVRARWSGNAL